MAKLVLLSEGLTGRSYELKVETTTIGRVEDNAFQIAEPSVSSHHCEVLLRGNDVVIKDLNSTNGTFIANQQITGEAVLKAGQVLRLGQIELRLETGAAGPAKKPVDSTMVIPKGVSLQQLEQGSQAGFDTVKGGFTKKSNKSGLIFWVVGAVVLLAILGGLAYAWYKLPNNR
jgi:pSer/pThr/pTyr-binding forkhead associated (FHA) protein